MMMLPPVEVPAAASLPALSVMALVPVLLVATAPDRVRSPLRVARLTVPLELMPSVLPTVPMVRAPLVVKLMLPEPAEAASVPTLLLTLSRVTLPPSSASLSATR